MGPSFLLGIKAVCRMQGYTSHFAFAGAEAKWTRAGLVRMTLEAGT